jgi:hypothetical protein
MPRLRDRLYSPRPETHAGQQPDLTYQAIQYHCRDLFQ